MYALSEKSGRHPMGGEQREDASRFEKRKIKCRSTYKKNFLYKYNDNDGRRVANYVDELVNEEAITAKDLVLIVIHVL
jgi:hypothetical protein